MAKRNGTKVTTNEVRFSYAHVFTPSAMEGNEPKYSVSLLIPKSDKETIKLIKEAIEEAKEIGKGKWNGKIPAKLKEPLRDGDEERPDDEAYEGCYFINATSKTKPGVVQKGSAGLVEITEESGDFYSGCYGKAAINFYGFNASGNRGIACGLNNVLKTKDGDAFGGSSRAEDDFADELGEDDDDFLG